MRSRRQTRRDARTLWHLCLVDGTLDEARARQVVEQMSASGYSGGPAILAEFLRLLRLERARLTARVETATPLDADVRAALEVELVRRYGRSLTAMFSVDPSLIGGMRLQVGSDVYDGSVKAGLAALAARF